MGRQTAIDRIRDIGASANEALDPGRLPVRFESHLALEVQQEDQVTTCEVILSDKDVSIRPLDSRLSGDVVVPLNAFAGVMVQIEPGLVPGTVDARLILKHHDPALSIVLIQTDQPEGFARSWPAWSRALGLPMLVCDIGGSVKPIEAFTAEAKNAPAPRRKLALLTGRRPRFLVRRRCGNAQGMRVHRGEREMIARR